MVLVYILKHNFHLNENAIFIPIYKIQKLKAKADFSQTSKAKTCLP